MGKGTVKFRGLIGTWEAPRGEMLTEHGIYEVTARICSVLWS